MLQVRAYPEAATGKFVSLVDFEKGGITGRGGHEQVKDFHIRPAGEGAHLKFVVNISRTGAGAMEASLPVGSSLVYRPGGRQDFGGYSLLSVAVYSRGVRDDLKLLLVTDQAGWESYPVLLRKGWNTVLMDIRASQAPAGFDLSRVREIRLRFNAPPGRIVDSKPVVINVDDIMLIDNRREIKPVPAGVRLVRAGLDYDLYLPGRAQPVRFRRGDDGLWRPAGQAAAVAIALPGAELPRGPDDLSAVGWQRMGEVHLAEHNRVRVQMSSTWYFPSAAGKWESLDIRRMHWQYTFYPDGRCFSNVTLHGMGAGLVAVTPPAAGIWSDGPSGRRILTDDGNDRRRGWSFLVAPPGDRQKTYQSNYAKPPTPEIKMGRRDVVYGDANGDGFDETEGCFRFRAAGGHCRLLLPAVDEGLADPVIRVSGRWISTVTANSAGAALRELVRLGDGSVVFRLPGMLDRPRWVEVTGKAPFPTDK